MKRMVSGIKPTGNLTLGNYIGAIKQFIEFQKEYESFVFVADLHALTVSQDPVVLREKIREIIGIYIACGLDGENTYLFNQSENLYHPAVSWALECNSYVGEMSRMTQYKDQVVNQKNESVTTGLFTYPILMAADILIYDADVVPVGIDQKQHVELTRNLAERFNNKYGPTFVVPTPQIPKVGAKIMNLQDPTEKMGKSSENTKGNIFLLDSLTDVRKKIMSSITDSESVVKYDVDNKPGISNLITIYSSVTGKSIPEIEKEFINQNYGSFKTKVADDVIKLLSEIQEKYYALIKDDTIEKALDKGLKKTEKIAKEKAYDVFHKLGVGRY